MLLQREGSHERGFSTSFYPVNPDLVTQVCVLQAPLSDGN